MSANGYVWLIGKIEATPQNFNEDAWFCGRREFDRRKLSVPEIPAEGGDYDRVGPYQHHDLVRGGCTCRDRRGLHRFHGSPTVN